MWAITIYRGAQLRQGAHELAARALARRAAPVCYGLCRHGLYSYGLYINGLYKYGLYSHDLWLCPVQSWPT